MRNVHLHPKTSSAEQQSLCQDQTSVNQITRVSWEGDALSCETLSGGFAVDTSVLISVGS